MAKRWVSQRQWCLYFLPMGQFRVLPEARAISQQGQNRDPRLFSHLQAKEPPTTPRNWYWNNHCPIPPFNGRFQGKKYEKWNAWFLRSKSIKYVWHVFSGVLQICPSTNSIVTIQYDYIFCPELLQFTCFAAPRAQYLHELAIPTKIVCNSTILIGQLGITWPMNTYKL